MTSKWAVCLPLARVAALGELRLASGVRVLALPEVGEIWLSGEACGDVLAKQLAALPEARQYVVLPDDQLVLHDHRVPTGRLPSGDWQTLATWLTPQLPLAALSGEAPARLPLRLVRGGLPGEANILLTSAREFERYAVHAPQHRLKRLSFAMNSASEAVVRGSPLPPIAGVRFVEQHGVAVEAGFCFDPPIGAEVVRPVLTLNDGDIVLLYSDGRFHHIAAEHFVRATRSAVRLSTRGMGNEPATG